MMVWMLSFLLLFLINYLTSSSKSRQIQKEYQRIYRPNPHFTKKLMQIRTSLFEAIKYSKFFDNKEEEEENVLKFKHINILTTITITGVIAGMMINFIIGTTDPVNPIGNPIKYINVILGMLFINTLITDYYKNNKFGFKVSFFAFCSGYFWFNLVF